MGTRKIVIRRNKRGLIGGEMKKCVVSLFGEVMSVLQSDGIHSRRRKRVGKSPWARKGPHIKLGDQTLR